MEALRSYSPGAAVMYPPPIDWRKFSTGQEKGQAVVALLAKIRLFLSQW